MNLKQTTRLLEVVHDLRTKCPWDKKQTHQTLVPYLIEEAYEAVDAIQSGDFDAMLEELGDVLLQVALHAEIASEKKKFTFEKVCGAIADKMIRRHPHIYEKKEVKDYKGHMKNWEKLKSLEKPKKKIMEGIPKSLPALQLSKRYGEIAASVGFDWQKADDVYGKLSEELREFQKEVRKKTKKQERVEEEFGDILFTLAQLSRHLKIDAENALKKSAEKFRDRVQKMEKISAKNKKKLHDLEPAALEALWEKSKRS